MAPEPVQSQNDDTSTESVDDPGMPRNAQDPSDEPAIPDAGEIAAVDGSVQENGLAADARTTDVNKESTSNASERP
jgi:hypothetical protein